jgi:hypothetical protein
VDRRPALVAAKRPKAAVVPVQFFGEYTLAWLPEKAVLAWGEGVARGCHTKGTKALQLGVREAAAFLGEGRRVAPPMWWCMPPPHLEEAAQQPAAGVPAAVPAAPAPGPPAEEPPAAPVVAAEAPPPAATAAPAALAAASPRRAAAAPAAARAAAVPAASPPRAGKLRWSARDILKPFVNRLKQLCPSLAADPMPPSTDDLFAYVRDRFGAAIDIDAPFKGKSAYDLVADLFTAVSGRPISAAHVADVFCLHISPLAPRVDQEALDALGLAPATWQLPLRPEAVRAPRATAPPPRPPQPRAPAAAPAAARAAAPAAAPAAAMLPLVGDEVPGGPVLDVINGRLVPRPRSRAAGADDAAAAAAGPHPAAASALQLDPTELAMRNRAPSYIHVKQNVWVSRPRPK